MKYILHELILCNLSSHFYVILKMNDKKINILPFAKEIELIIIFRTDNRIFVYCLTSLDQIVKKRMLQVCFPVCFHSVFKILCGTCQMFSFKVSPTYAKLSILKSP